MEFKIRNYKILFIMLAMLLSAITAWAIDDDFDAAPRAFGKYTAVYYSADTNPPDLVKKINMLPSDRILAGMPSGKRASGPDELPELLDSLFLRVSDILGIHLYNLQVNIKICRNLARLKEIYNKLFNSSLGDRLSFYVYDLNTIYVSEEGFRREIVGPEMAHAIICHYFVVPPPVKIQEVLAMYVEYNLRHTEK